VTLTTHFHLVPRLIMYGAILPLLQQIFRSWCLVKCDFIAWYLFKHRDNFTLP